MNERIRELAEQATELDCTTFDSYNHKTVEHYKFNREKFAELIVQECLYIVEGEDDCTDATIGVRLAMIRMKQHFGVEE